MPEEKSIESLRQNETMQDIFLLVAWSVVLCLCSLTLKNYYLSGQPPLWDNLVYQQKSLQILTHWMDGHWAEAAEKTYSENFPAYIIAIAFSFLLFGFKPFSPYIVSAFFGTGCMVATYLLSRELSASRRVAFWGVIAFSLLPNFIYQNFFQTRNDFPVAFFMALSWLFFIRGIKQPNIKQIFLAGLLAGVGTLFKASTPGYMAWGILIFTALPEKCFQLNLKSRTNFSLTFVGGAVLGCGWHFLPNLSEILNYYSTWGKAQTFVATQYGLQSNWTDSLFYLKNIISLHLGEKVALGLALANGVLAIRYFLKKKTNRFQEEDLKEWRLIFLVFLAGMLPIFFISLKGSFASVGDIPVLTLLAAASIAIISKFSTGMNIPKFLMAALLPAGLFLSISNLQIIEKPFSGKSLKELSKETMKIRKEFGLGKTPMMQVYSHPIYNTNTLSWLWLINPTTDRSLIQETTNSLEIIFPEEAETIASKLKKKSLIIMSEYPGTVIQGGNFTTLNRLHYKINSALEKQGQFIKLRSLDLEEGRFPVHFMLNKNYSALYPTRITTDHWVEWEGEMQYFASRPAKLIWRGIPIRKLDSFLLNEKNDPTSSITMRLNQVLPDGRHEFISGRIPPAKELRTFNIMPESPDLLLAASKTDSRMLAFHKVETEVAKYD